VVLVKKFPAFYNYQKFITAFMRTLPFVPTLSEINSVAHFPKNFLKIHFNIIFPSKSSKCCIFSPHVHFLAYLFFIDFITVTKFGVGQRP